MKAENSGGYKQKKQEFKKQDSKYMLHQLFYHTQLRGHSLIRFHHLLSHASGSGM